MGGLPPGLIAPPSTGTARWVRSVEFYARRYSAHRHRLPRRHRADLKKEHRHRNAPGDVHRAPGVGASDRVLARLASSSRPPRETAPPTRNAATGTRRTTPTHSGGLNGVAFSPCGSLIATASRDGTGHIWDAASGTSRRTLRGHSDWVRDVAFSADGTLVATASKDGTVQLWDSAPGRSAARLRLPNAPRSRTSRSPLTARSSPPHRASRHQDLACRDGGSRAAVTLTRTPRSITAVAFSPDGSLIAAAAATGAQASGTLPRPSGQRSGHAAAVRDIAFSPNSLSLSSPPRQPTARCGSGTARPDHIAARSAVRIYDERGWRSPRTAPSSRPRRTTAMPGSEPRGIPAEGHVLPANAPTAPGASP